MFDKLVKMKNQKGFTLVEMLIVIAIIAILVSIIIPTVSKSTTKANAATNAANMRAVKGTVSTLLVSGDLEINNFTANDAFIQEAEEMANQLKNNPLTYLFGLIAEGVVEGLKRAEQSSYTYYAQDGKIDINGQILDAPVAKQITVGDLTLRKGTEMTVTVSENNIVVTYGGIPIEVMALIAQGGDYSEIDMSTIDHTYIDSNGDNICDVCNGAFDHRDTDKFYDSVQNAVSGAHSCSDSTNDCICDDGNCGLKIPCTNNGQYVCSNCATPIKHDFYDSDGCNGDDDTLCDHCKQAEDNLSYHN